jgi:hypothetical protein
MDMIFDPGPPSLSTVPNQAPPAPTPSTSSRPGPAQRSTVTSHHPVTTAQTRQGPKAHANIDVHRSPPDEPSRTPAPHSACDSKVPLSAASGGAALRGSAVVA